MEENLPVVYDSKAIQENVFTFSKGLKTYLEKLELPTNNVLVEIRERGKVIANMPNVIFDNLSIEQRKRAYYISKFIASATVGLFDAALNYLWNETILNLREKIIRFDLDYFFDSTISDSSRRKTVSTPEDLLKLDDWELIRGCRETGIISDMGYKHLDYIRDMRNFASAAHPNQNQLTGLQLVSWLETCIIEVLAKEPSGPVLEVRKLLRSIRTETIDEKNAKSIITNIQKLPRDLAHSLLRAVFGMYTDENLSQNNRDNITRIAKAIWNQSDEEAKYDIGLKYAIFSANAEIKRKELANNFLNIVDGLGYLTEDLLVIEINEKLENLLNAHNNYNNFYNEEPHAKILYRYIPNTGKIPETIRYNYVKVLIICRLGNYYGVSNVSLPYYDAMIKMFRDEEIFEFIELLKDEEILTILNHKKRLDIFNNITKSFLNKTQNEILKKAITKILASPIADITTKKVYDEVKKLINT